MGELEICELKSSDERIKKEINNCHFVYCIAKAKDLVARCGKRPTPAPQTVRYVPVDIRCPRFMYLTLYTVKTK
ncbi:MAG: hypothetical protein AAB488_02200, partial [Patescibacteria group bacterium]